MDAKSEFLDIIKTVKAYIRAERESGLGEILMPPKPQPLLSLKARLLNCNRCCLYKTRNNVVFGDGNPKAKLIFVGEAPGFDEDLQGSPFVGQAGKLLTKMIESIGLSREGVYICNVLKCRPPGNRSPLPEEVAACKEYLLTQIDIISPMVICCLGKHATSALLETDEPISRIRGRHFDYKGIVLIPTFHPAYLLRNPSAKKEAWKDLKEIKRILSEV